MIGIADIEAASARIAPHVRRTPSWVLPSRALQVDGPPFEVWLKLEQLQVSGSFKARGMFNRLLANPIPAAGVIAASGGNAGIAAATAARALCVPAEIFVPTVISAAKRERLEGLGACVVVTGAVYADALAACEQRQRETGALMTHAYDQPEVLAGAGTLAREIEQQLGVPDALLVSVGGGGLLGGIASWFAGRTQLVALEPRGAPTLHRALAAGAPVDVEVSGLAADALGARRIGNLAWEVAQRHPMASLLLDDTSIRDAQRLLWNSFKLAVEPAAALPLAALRSGAWRPDEAQRVCLIICGANVDPATLA